MGVQFGAYPTDQGTPDANFGAAVDGNYGFGDGCFDGTLDATDPSAPTCTDSLGADVPFTALGADDYLVHIDLADKTDANGQPIYKVTREEDINIGNGDSFVPQVPPPACAGPLHQVDVAGFGTNGYGATAIPDPSGTTVTGTASGGTLTTLVDATQAWAANQWAGDQVTITAGAGIGQVATIISNTATTLTVAAWPVAPNATSQYELVAMLHVGASTPTANATFVDIGASPYEGQAKPLCDTKLVPLQNGKSVVPMFNVFTDVPLPGRFFALNNSDLVFSTDPKSLLYGEKAGIPFSPVGIYDWSNRLVTTVETDYNGLFDVLLPSTNRINCPTPSGVCGNLYRFVGNDPGIPGRLNLNYNPQYRTIAAEFETWPGIIVPADTAPTQVGVTVQLPGGQTNTALSCPVNDPAAAPATRTPELYAVSRPYVSGTTTAARSFTITGLGFGAPQGTGAVTIDGLTSAQVTVTSWSDTQIGVTVPAGAPVGPHQLRIRASNGKSTVNGITIHVIGTGYNPSLYEVGPGRTYAPVESLPAAADHAIQDALDDAATFMSPEPPTPAGAPWWWSIPTTRVSTPARTRAARTTRT